LGYRFSPRIADIGGARYWRIDSSADYGPLNGIARHRVNLNLIRENWDDLLRLAGSLKLGLVQATSIMRTLRIDDRPTRLAQAVAELGRIDKTNHSLTYVDDESKRRRTLTQLNRGEDRHKLGRAVFHGKRGELRQRYREGQEDQLGALGLVVNIIVLWNTLYIDAALQQLRTEGFPVKAEDLPASRPWSSITSISWAGIPSRCPIRFNAGNSDRSETHPRRQTRPPPEALCEFSVPLLPKTEFAMRLAARAMSCALLIAPFWYSGAPC
jgi:hypothetical protein